jgi:hypothetical protein
MNPLSLFSQTSNDIYAMDTANVMSSAAIAALIMFTFIFIIIFYILISIMLARIFRKAGVEGWKAWVPVYNTWVTLEIGGQKGWWALLLFIPIANIIATVFLYIAMYNIGLHLNKEDYFILWAIFLPVVWYAWLAYDNSTWNTSKVAAPNTASSSNHDNHPAAPLL